MSDFRNICIKMNHWGIEGIPFLFVFDFELLKPMVFRLDKLPWWIRYSTPKYPAERSNRICQGYAFHKKVMDYPTYHEAFSMVMKHLKQGDTYLLNLTFPTPITSDLSLSDIFEFSTAPYRLLVDNTFVVFSPEPFIKISNGKIKSYPMKGTIDAAIPDAQNKVLEDFKESAEHFTIVDLIRNDLSKVASGVTVSKFRYIETIKTHEKSILQVSSEITGNLSDDYYRHIGDIVGELLPAGSISGAPKRKTLEIIRMAEKIPRGYYTGIFGVFDGNELDSAVMIRYIEKKGGKLQFRSGGGITHLSEPWSEYCEMIDKVYVSFA